MREVLISIKPKWCELIASDKKTVEVRKTRPKCDVPFKCYIYQTKIKWVFDLLRKAGLKNLADRLLMGLGKVIGEFVCDKVFDIYEFSGSRFWLNETLVKATCLTEKEINDYGKGNDIFGWHISNLVIYDKPRELSEFSHTKEYVNKIRNSVVHWEYGVDDTIERPIKRPPQSWCYVESEEAAK